MKSLRAVLFAEALKIRRSRVIWIATLALSLGPIMGALFVVVLRTPALQAANPALATKAAMTGFSPDWRGFLGLMSQVVGVGGVILFGFISSWVFGREFSDRTAKDLLSLPTTRTTIVAAKMISVGLCCFLIAFAVLAVGLVLGVTLGLEGWATADLPRATLTFVTTTALTVLLCPPVAFVASAGRGYLAPLGFVVLALVCAQILGALGLGSYMPWAVPGLYSGLAAGSRASLTMLSYALVFFTAVAGTLATFVWWQYADQTG